MKQLRRILLETCLIRRLKENTLPELPPKHIKIVKIKGDNFDAYHEAEIDFIQWLKKRCPIKARRAKRAEALVKIGYLKRLAADGKIQPLIRWLKNFMRKNPDEKIVFFGWHEKFIKAVEAEFPPYERVTVTGKTPHAKREWAVTNFQTNKRVRLFLGNLQAAGVGLTLTAARIVVIGELSFVPAEVSQAIDRCHRIGQTEDVYVFIPISDETIECRLCDLIQTKQKQAQNLLDGNRENTALHLKDRLIQHLKDSGSTSS